jgi:hypothetical protein
MCKKKRREKGMFVVSHIGDDRSCKFTVGTKVAHLVEVVNETASQCVASVRISCPGDHVATPSGDEWTDDERELDPGQKGHFHGNLLFIVGSSGGRQLPADEDVQIELFWRPLGTEEQPLSRDDMETCFKYRHPLTVEQNT